MTGTETYNKEFDAYVKKRLKDNSNRPYLKGFYYFLLSDGKRSHDGSYNYLGRVINFLDYCDINKAENITFDNYTEYLAYAYEGKSSSHQIVTYSALKAFSRYLKAKGLTDDFMSYIKRPKFSESDETKAKREIGYMTQDEVKLFLNNIKNSYKRECWKSRDYAMALILLNTGIRCAALQKLDIDNINLDTCEISVLEKGGKARNIYFSENIKDHINSWLTYRKEILGRTKTNALFISDHKTRMSRKTIYNTIKAYGSVIEGKNITTHKTRSTYGTSTYDATHDIYFVQECMGHSNPKTTELYIRGQKTEFTKKAADIMGSILV